VEHGDGLRVNSKQYTRTRNSPIVRQTDRDCDNARLEAV